MKAKYVYENIRFERGQDPRRGMDIGVTAENRDPRKMRTNFEKAFPGFHGHTGQLHSSSGNWHTYTTNIPNPKDGISVEERKELILDWFRRNTDYDDFEITSAFDRYWHPWGDESKPEQYEQQFSIQMRHTPTNESYNFERGQDPKRTMGVGKASKVNYFRDNLEGISYKELMKDNNSKWPWDQGEDILKVAADMLGVPENEVLIAIEYDNEPLTTSVIEQKMEDHEWEYDDAEGNTEDFDLIQSSTGEIYVVGMDERTPYMILGTAF